MKINGESEEFGIQSKVKNGYFQIQQETQINEDESDDENITSSLIEVQQINKFKIKILVYFISILSVIFYILSLEGCHDTQTACLVNLNPSFLNRLIIFLIISGFLYSLVIYFTINNAINLSHFLILTLIFAFLTLYFTGSDLANHGSYNRSLFIIVIPIFVSLFFVFKLLYYLYLGKFYKLILLMIFILFFTSINVYFNLTFKCSERWSEGYFNKTIDNTNPPFRTCRLKIPSYCWIDFLDNFMDFSQILSEDCNNFRKGERDHFLKYLPSHIDKKSLEYYYPLTNVMDYIPNSMFDQFFYNLMDNISTVKTERNSEILLRFDNYTNLGTIYIDLKRNESLVKKRRELADKSNAIKTKNILFIYIDSISRRHFQRKMKKSFYVLEKYLIKTQKYHFYQFLKYQAFIYFTQLNTNPMFYGKSMYSKSGTHILKHFHDNGFITGHSNNFCSRELYDIEKGYIENITFIPFDHENAALFCDPNYFSVENPYTPYMGPYSMKRRCLYGKDTFNYVLEYSEKFWEAYLEERKFLRIAFQDAHEGTGEVVKYLDDSLAKFLKKFIKKDWLKDTTIMFVSDHGNAMMGFHNLFDVDDFVTEKTLPLLLLMIPSSFFNNSNIVNKELIDRNLDFNRNIMITSYDIYYTLLDLLGIDFNSFHKQGESLLNKIEDGDQRNCKKYENDMIKLWCRCSD